MFIYITQSYVRGGPKSDLSVLWQIRCWYKDPQKAETRPLQTNNIRISTSILLPPLHELTQILSLSLIPWPDSPNLLFFNAMEKICPLPLLRSIAPIFLVVHPPPPLYTLGNESLSISIGDRKRRGNCASIRRSRVTSKLVNNADYIAVSSKRTRYPWLVGESRVFSSVNPWAVRKNWRRGKIVASLLVAATSLAI